MTAGKIACAVFFLAYAATAFVSGSDGYVNLVSMVPLLGLIAAILYMVTFIVCPKCKAKLAQATIQNTSINFCPVCGADFSLEKDA